MFKWSVVGSEGCCFRVGPENSSRCDLHSASRTNVMVPDS